MFKAPSETCIVRPAEISDYPQMILLLTTLEFMHPELTFEHFFVLEQNQKIIGVACLLPVKEAFFLEYVGLDPAVQGKGFSRFFIDTLLNMACFPVYLYTIIPDFWQKMGFKKAIPIDSLPEKIVHLCQLCEPDQCVCMVFDSHIPLFPLFKTLDETDISRLQLLFSPFQLTNCELNVANLFLWRSFYSPQLTRVFGNICILIGEDDGSRSFLEPVGDNEPEKTIKTCIDYSNCMSHVSDLYTNKHSFLKPHLTPLRDYFDYIYRVQSLADLKGRKYDGKRNHINRFKKQFSDYQFRPITESDSDAVIAVFETWSSDKRKKDQMSKQDVSMQLETLTQSFRYYQRLNLIGGCIEIDGEIKGFVIGSADHPEMVVLHFMCGLVEIPGIYQVLIQDSCQTIYSEYQFMNMEQDLGKMGLRRSKKSNYPEFFVEKYLINL